MVRHGDGSPVTRATLWLYNDDGQTVAGSDTDADGPYRLTTKPRRRTPTLHLAYADGTPAAWWRARATG